MVLRYVDGVLLDGNIHSIGDDQGVAHFPRAAALPPQQSVRHTVLRVAVAHPDLRRTAVQVLQGGHGQVGCGVKIVPLTINS